jgi:hypothetical protein
MADDYLAAYAELAAPRRSTPTEETTACAS